MSVHCINMHVFSDQLTRLGGFRRQVTETAYCIEVSLLMCSMMLVSIWGLRNLNDLEIDLP